MTSHTHADEIVQQSNSSDSSSFTFNSFKTNHDYKAFCEQALERLIYRGNPTFFVRPGFEDQFRTNVEAYVSSE